jgi:hypothetical protein
MDPIKSSKKIRTPPSIIHLTKSRLPAASSEGQAAVLTYFSSPEEGSNAFLWGTFVFMKKFYEKYLAILIAAVDSGGSLCC